MLFWSADFEEGTYYDIDDAGYPFASGGTRLVQWNGEYGSAPSIAGASVDLETEIVFSGSYASRSAFTQDTVGTCRAEVARWAPTRDYADAYYGVALYLSTGFRVPYPDGWCVVLQLLEPSEPWRRLAILELTESDEDYLHFRLTQNRGVWNELWEDTVPAPTGQWLRIVIHLNIAVNGQLELWINDILRASLSGDFSSQDVYPGPQFKSGIYAENVPAQYLLVDEMRCGDSYADARPQRSDPSPAILFGRVLERVLTH
jgi:hypothetical protein